MGLPAAGRSIRRDGHAQSRRHPAAATCRPRTEDVTHSTLAPDYRRLSKCGAARVHTFLIPGARNRHSGRSVPSRHTASAPALSARRSLFRQRISRPSARPCRPAPRSIWAVSRMPYAKHMTVSAGLPVLKRPQPVIISNPETPAPSRPDRGNNRTPGTYSRYSRNTAYCVLALQKHMI